MFYEGKRPFVKYDILAQATISDLHEVIISKSSIGGFVISKAIEKQSNGRVTRAFLKDGTIIVDDFEKLVQLRDALNVAIDKSEIVTLQEEYENELD